MNNIQANKDKFIGILKQVERNGIEDLIQLLENSDFFLAPASTKYHDAEEGGLCKHSLEVFRYLRDEALEEYLYESVIVVALLHDLCKINFYKKEMRNTKNDFGKWIQVPYYTVEDKFPYGHGEKSVYLIQKVISITDAEAMAIRWHMGGFVPKEEYMALSEAYKQNSLALYLHIADMKATYL